jgi:hypothetical protein
VKGKIVDRETTRKAAPFQRNPGRAVVVAPEDAAAPEACKHPGGRAGIDRERPNPDLR